MERGNARAEPSHATVLGPTSLHRNDLQPERRLTSMRDSGVFALEWCGGRPLSVRRDLRTGLFEACPRAPRLALACARLTLKWNERTRRLADQARCQRADLAIHFLADQRESDGVTRPTRDLRVGSVKPTGVVV